jgi:hypothetical protein
MRAPEHAEYFLHAASRNRLVAKKAHLVLLSHSAFFVTVLFGSVLGIVAGSYTKTQSLWQPSR